MGSAKNLDKSTLQRIIRVIHRDRQAEIDETCNTIALLADSAGHDAVEMREVWLNIQRNAVEGYPFAQADADCRDLVLEACALVRPLHPDPDTRGIGEAHDIEMIQRCDDPCFEC